MTTKTLTAAYNGLLGQALPTDFSARERAAAIREAADLRARCEAAIRSLARGESLSDVCSGFSARDMETCAQVAWEVELYGLAEELAELAAMLVQCGVR